jgi:hypothetical protein
MRAEDIVASHSRTRFIERVAEAFEDAGVNYAILHERLTGAPDSDVDVAVGRESLELVDWIVRSGTFGIPLQRLDYDVPWCRYYVTESNEPGRRYRQLDVACDPWGIGRYGVAISLALETAQRTQGRRVATGAAQTLYLALKRASKAHLRPGDAEELRRVFRHDRAAARDALEHHFGDAGAALADALASERADITMPLRVLYERAERVRSRPMLVCRRALYEIFRVARRFLRPTGLVVALVGPDGIGKSTLAVGLEGASSGAFRRATRLHFGPGLLPPPARLLGRATPDGSQPHRRPPSGSATSLARVFYLWLDALVGWWPKVSVPRIRSTLVVLERGWADLVVDPRRYRTSRGTGLARQLARFLPAPDLVLFLDGEAEVAHGRKRELEVAEIDRQLKEWRSLAREDANRFETLDATRPAEDVLDQAVVHVNRRLAARQLDIRSWDIALVCLGTPAQEGRRYWLVARRGRPRWLLQAQSGAAGLLRSGIYRPAQARHLAGAKALDLIVRGTGGRVGVQSSITVDPEAGLAPVIASRLGRKRVQITGVALPKDRGERALLSICDDSQLIAFAKVAREGARLGHERHVLEELGRIGPRTFVTPRVLDFFDWRGVAVLVLEPLPVVGRSDRPLAEREMEALVELAQLGDALEPVLGNARAGVPAHGDFAPWNSGRTESGLLALWDWEEANLGDPLEDYFHWHVQRLVLLSAGTVTELVRRTLDPDPILQALCGKLSVPREALPYLLRAYLERAATSTSPAAEVRERTIEVLEGVGV